MEFTISATTQLPDFTVENNFKKTEEIPEKGAFPATRSALAPKGGLAGLTARRLESGCLGSNLAPAI